MKATHMYTGKQVSHSLLVTTTFRMQYGNILYAYMTSTMCTYTQLYYYIIHISNKVTSLASVLGPIPKPTKPEDQVPTFWYLQCNRLAWK